MDAPAPNDARLSRYRLERLLGSGGMGSVHLAYDLSLERLVAIKFISPEKAAEESARRRLVREARAAAALEHPNICAVYEVIDEPGTPPFIVMQYVEGETLSALLRSGPLEIRFALNIAADVASALSLAHKRRIIHRDIKPQNIIITPERRAKLVDFGIAAYYDEPGGLAGDVPTSTRLTETGDAPGTPAYMSPEQVHGRQLDGRSDLFALGTVLFECLTGRRAFDGRNALELAGQIVSHDPPPVSSLRPELGEAHDELCRRLLAKDPRDRFGSADELLGALQMLATGTHPQRPPDDRRPRTWWERRSIMAGIAGGLLAVVAGVLALQWDRGPSVPSDPQAAAWYQRGIEAIREGLPHSARLALNEAIKAEPDYAPAFIRLAEAEIELDDADAAERALLRVSSLVESESRLPFEDRTRVQAVRALMLRDVDTAVQAYRTLAERNPKDPGAWLDVGRALDASGLRTDARESYEKALQLNDDYAAAHLRRGTILGLEGRRDDALAAFDEAERLYRASANVEGQVEALIQRAVVLNNGGDLKEARAALTRASDMVTGSDSRPQQIRTQLILSSITASEGRWTEAEKVAGTAVDGALNSDLETIAAEGLIELGNVYFYQGRLADAEKHSHRALELARKRGVERIAARATLQQASLMIARGNHVEALRLAADPLEYAETNRFRRLELAALTILSRAREALGEYDQARALSERALRTSTQIKDDSQLADTLENLAGQTEAVGALPESLGYRQQSLDIHRHQNDLSRLGYDLVNTADLLVRLGRHQEAVACLDEIETGAEKELEAYVQRLPAARTIRLLSAAIRHEPIAVPAAQDLAGSDFAAQFSPLLLDYLRIIQGGSVSRTSGLQMPGSAAPDEREFRYWHLAARVAGQQYKDALGGAEATLAGEGSETSYEFEWRVAAIAAAAANEPENTERHRRYLRRAQGALDRLRREWKSDVDAYLARPDLAQLRRLAGLK